jgi:hypothetical protein
MRAWSNGSNRWLVALMWISIRPSRRTLYERGQDHN